MPAIGVCVIVTWLQSVATTWPVRSGMAAWQQMFALLVRLVAQVLMTGAVVSLMLNNWAQLPTCPQASVRVKVRWK